MYGVTHSINLAGDIEPTLCRQFLPILGNEAAITRCGVDGYGQHGIAYSAFEIHMRSHYRFDLVEIVILYMPSIFTQMHRNAVRPGCLSQADSISRTRITRPACLPQCRDMVYVDTEI